MAGRLSRRRNNPESSTNVIPAIGVFGNILVFLILSASYIKATIIEINLPKAEAAAKVGSKKGKPKKPKTLTITVGKKGLILGGSLGKRQAPIPLKEGKYQFDLLTEKLAKIKALHPAHQDVVLLFTNDIKYDYIIRAIDATRYSLKSEEGVNKREELFPNVALGESFIKKKKGKG